MGTRAGFVVRGLLGAFALTSLGATPADGQSAPAPSPSPATNWTAPRTPWGDPDIQGDYTNKYEQGTPFERPPEFEGRRLDDIQGEELKALIQDRAIQVLLNAPFTGGDPEAGNFGGAPAFYDRFEAARGSRLWFVVDPPDGRVPPMSPDGQRASAARSAARTAARRGRGAADSYEDRSLYDRCITRGLPGSMMPSNYGNSYRIVQSPGYVAITYEMVHETRLIPIDTTPHVGAQIRSYMGDARGRWEGDTLVVETTNFRNEPVYRGSNPETLRLIERFKPTGSDTLEWSVTVDDPTSWSRPWTFAMPLTRNDDEAVLEYACHEGNRAMENLLRAARAEEQLPAAPTRSGDRSPVASTSAATVVAAPVKGDTGLSGDWALDATASGRSGGRVPNFAGYAAATRMMIRQSQADVTVAVNTGTENQIQTAVYRLDGSENTVPGPLGWDTRAKAAWKDGTLVVAVTRSVEGPNGPVTFSITDTYSVSGDLLTLERSTGSRTQKLVYTRK